MLVKCDNCDWRGDSSDVKFTLEEVVDLGERLDPGSEVPYGECPQCDCLCYLDRPVLGMFDYEQGTMTRKEHQLRYVARKLRSECNLMQYSLSKRYVEVGNHYPYLCGWCVSADALEQAADKENADHGRFVATKEE